MGREEKSYNYNRGSSPSGSAPKYSCKQRLPGPSPGRAGRAVQSGKSKTAETEYTWKKQIGSEVHKFKNEQKFRQEQT